MHKFIAKRTNFAVYEETMTDIPTVTTFIYGDGHYVEYGKDFNISYGEAGSSKPWTNLKFGETLVPGTDLLVQFERVINTLSDLHQSKKGWQNSFRITPLNFSPKMPIAYKLKYNFKENTTVSKVGLRLSTDIGAIAFSSRSFDDDYMDHQCGVGQGSTVIISATKYKYLKVHGCQEKSPNEILVDRILEKMSQKCSKPCRVEGLRLGRVWREKVEHLPYCNNPTELRCFERAFKKSKNTISGIKQCKKLQYKAISNEHADKKDSEERNQANFRMIFANREAKVQVKEEYLIYDGVAMISAIGGTLGLCIGFSFYDLSSKLMFWLEVGTSFKRVRANPANCESKGNVKEMERILTQRINALEFRMESFKNIIESSNNCNTTSVN